MSSSNGSAEVLIAGTVLLIAFSAIGMFARQVYVPARAIASAENASMFLDQRLGLFRGVVAKEGLIGFLRSHAVSGTTGPTLFNPPVDIDLSTPASFLGVFGVPQQESLQFQGKTLSIKYELALRKVTGITPPTAQNCGTTCELREVAYLLITAVATSSDTASSRTITTRRELVIAP